jgi:hypothetical protein
VTLQEKRNKCNNSPAAPAAGLVPGKGVLKFTQIARCENWVWRTVFLYQLILRSLLLILLLELTSMRADGRMHTQSPSVFTLADFHCFQADARNSFKIMKLTVRRYGGYAGINALLVVLDTKSLSAEKEVALRAVLERMQRLLPLDQAAGADFIHYEILIEQPGVAQQILLFADDESDKARQLVELTNKIVAMGEKP